MRPFHVAILVLIDIVIAGVVVWGAFIVLDYITNDGNDPNTGMADASGKITFAVDTPSGTTSLALDYNAPPGIRQGT